jgi:hypothetical protein
MTAEELAAFSERAARLIAGGGGLRALAQLLADEMQGAVLIEDEGWRHLAFAHSKRQLGSLPPSFAPYYRQAGRHAGDGTVVRAALSGSLHAVCAAMPSPGGDGDSTGGYVTLFVAGKPPPRAILATRIAAGAAAIEHARRGAGRAQARQSFWERFLSGTVTDAASLRAEAQAAGIDLAPAYAAAVFSVEGTPPGAVREVVAQAVAPADGLCPLPASGSEVVVLFPLRHKVDVTRAKQAAANVVRDLPAQGAAAGVTCGLGAPHSDLLGVPSALREARQALAIGRRILGRGSVAFYPDLGIYALLHAGATRDEFAAFAAGVLEPLIAYDRKHKTDLLATLALYLEVGENVKEAAEQLSVHRHTIFYRLNQISQILKLDLRTPRGQLVVRTALAIHQMQDEPRS